MAEELKVIESIDDLTPESLEEIDAMGSGEEDAEEEE